MDTTAITDPAAPELFPAAFPREGFPRYDWTERPAGLPAAAWCTETTHRDGQQGGLPLTVEDGVRIYDLICAFTGASGAVRQAEFFVYRRDDRAMLEAALERHAGGAPVEPTTWIRASRRDADLVRGIGVRETGMLASASDYHTFHKFTPGGRRQAAEAYLDAVRAVLDAGLRPRLHLEDATRAPEEFVLPFAQAVLEACAPFGPELRPKFRVCDTMGLGLPLDGVAAPRSVPRWIRRLRELGIAGEDLEFHPHNDTHLVVANCLAAIEAGCAVVNGTLLGKGERTGNAPLEGVLLHVIGMGLLRRAAARLPRPERPRRPLRAHRRPAAGDLPAVRARRPPHARGHPRRRAEQVLVDVRALRRAGAHRPAAGGEPDARLGRRRAGVPDPAAHRARARQGRPRAAAGARRAEPAVRRRPPDGGRVGGDRRAAAQPGGRLRVSPSGPGR